MQQVQIHDYARKLMELYGPKAIAEAAQKAADLETQGDLEQAKTWRNIKDALKQMRGPHQS
ncbi:hypothetical protein [Bradyrhizobium sp. LHD-71]|uniref:hypothetical protein n=1 Tax=Bradyrhizobium sp. LHD-71 TaxID=3072141 RepID=UPI00280E7D24|nr:hypothetical protein [Bradyrhizobium sp. LHD-71]MDQ8732451.1 hypothetical protein [Bradyrhizobium sp. LHD-71]